MDTEWSVEFLNDTAEAEFDHLSTEIKAKIVRISQLIEQVGLLSIPPKREIELALQRMKEFDHG